MHGVREHERVQLIVENAARVILAADGRIGRVLLEKGLMPLLDALMAAGENAHIPAAQDSHFSEIIRSAVCAPPGPAAEALPAFFSGSDLREYHAHCALDSLTPWQFRVMQAMAAIERGKVLSYGGLAKLLGATRRTCARAVGNACARNPIPLLYPCHRVVKSDGQIGAFMSAHEGAPVALKRRLLEFEGVRFDARGRVLAECFAD